MTCAADLPPGARAHVSSCEWSHPQPSGPACGTKPSLGQPEARHSKAPRRAPCDHNSRTRYCSIVNCLLARLMRVYEGAGMETMLLQGADAVERSPAARSGRTFRLVSLIIVMTSSVQWEAFPASSGAIERTFRGRFRGRYQTSFHPTAVK